MITEAGLLRPNESDPPQASVTQTGKRRWSVHAWHNLTSIHKGTYRSRERAERVARRKLAKYQRQYELELGWIADRRVFTSAAKTFRRYTYTVRWSQEDGEFVATVAEYPSLSWLGSSPQEALTGVVNLAEGVADDA